MRPNQAYIQMASERIIFQVKWIAVKESSRGFQYLERKGKDLVAVFLLRKSSDNVRQHDVLIRQQPLCLDNTETDGIPKLFPCPITGAFDTRELPFSAAVREVYEDSGCVIQVLPMDKYIVGTQINNTCSLYGTNATAMKPDEVQQDGAYHESISINEWHPFEYLATCDYSACHNQYYRMQGILQRAQLN